MDALNFRSAAKQGYFKDDFVHLFGQKITRRIPLVFTAWYNNDRWFD